MSVHRMRIAVLISGRGSNLQALIEACAAEEFPARIVLVLSNRPGAEGLKRAADAGLATAVVDHTKYDERDDFEAAMDAELREAGTELICLAGFMRILNPEFVNRWRDKILNIHPSLLPAFKGLHVHERVIAAGTRVTGCTVHFVRAELDDGPIVNQAVVPVLPGDSPDDLAGRVLPCEHSLYPEAVRLVASGEARVSGDVVKLSVDGREDGAPTLFSPAAPGQP